MINAICVDSEPKVIRKLQKQVKGGFFRDSNMIVGRRGRGNNWALGYSRCTEGTEKSLVERTMESFRHELERKDCYTGTVLLHSLCGGTGSGLGARLCEEIRDTYPAGYILTVTVAPHESGDTPLQHYNSLLCLAWLQRYSDGIILFQNDEVMRRAGEIGVKKVLTVSGVEPPVSLPAMNSHISSCLAGLLYPTNTLRTRSAVSVGLEPWEMIRTLCPMSTLKFLQTAHTSRRGTAFWDRVASSVAQSVPRTSPDGRTYHSLSLLAVARGSQEKSFLLSQDSVLRKLKHSYHCVPWNPFPVDCWTGSQKIFDSSQHSHSLTVCSNHSSTADLIKKVINRAQAMYDARAYLHWYKRYGCAEEDFQAAFQTLHSVVEEYSLLGKP
ncbi:hypothetical protein GDO86_012024 [Hymenochirus boettgeri]|uniref:Tubulin delta chain n=1 Tax=Hymenochirus boettgeri TaxID=247094 RepID=A0A8T2JDT4_9PIPI|nr:hypothetical protein GDO86_012024 [Hymenochirus boettgeri]